MNRGRTDSEAYALGFDGSKVIMAGSVDGYQYSDFGVTKIFYDGTLDTSFSNQGWSKESATGFDVLKAISVMVDSSFIGIGSSDSNFVVVKYNSSGWLDTSFGSNGMTKVSAGSLMNGAVSGDGIYGVGSYNGDFSIKKFSFSGAVIY